jgi:GNAT superfamily N-acetyltransferase
MSAEVDVTFVEPGPLGLSFGSEGNNYEDAVGPKVVLAIEADGGASRIPDCPIEVGLELVRVQGEPCGQLSFSDTLDLIKGGGRPLTLTFRAPDVALDWVESDESEPEPEPEPAPTVYQEMMQAGGWMSLSPPKATAPLVVRRYRQETDAAAVRRIWPAGLLANTRNAALGYPATLIAEEEEFVRETMTSGDMCDLQAAYQSDPGGATDFWVVTEQGGVVPVGMVGLRHGKGEGVGDIGRFGVDDACQRRGAARLLLGALERHAWHAGFTKLTATTCGLNTPALAAFEACGFRVVFNGRQDGKPQPEWAPFARLEKAAPGVQRQPHHAMGQQAPHNAEAGPMEDIEEEDDDEVEDQTEEGGGAGTPPYRPTSAGSAPSAERQQRVELLLRRECEALRSEKSRLEAQVSKLMEAHSTDTEQLAQSAAAAAISAVREQMEKTAEEARRLSDENAVLRQHLAATLLAGGPGPATGSGSGSGSGSGDDNGDRSGNVDRIGGRRYTTTYDEHQRALDSLDLSLGMSPGAGSGGGGDSAMISPVPMLDSHSRVSSSGMTPEQQQVLQAQRIVEQERTIFELQQQLDGVHVAGDDHSQLRQPQQQRGANGFSDGGQQQLESANAQLAQTVHDMSASSSSIGAAGQGQMVGGYSPGSTGSLSPQEVLVSRLIATGADTSPPQMTAMGVFTEQDRPEVVWSGSRRGSGGVTTASPAAVNGNAAWLPRGTPGRKRRGGQTVSTSREGSRGSSSVGSSSVGSARGSTKAGGRAAGKQKAVDNSRWVEEPSMARQSDIWAAGLRGSTAGAERESASARRRRRLLDAASSKLRTPPRR